MFPVSKFFVLVLSLVVLAMGIYGTTKVTERLVVIMPHCVSDKKIRVILSFSIQVYRH